MIQDILYGDVNLKVLKFVEVNDNEDIKKTKSDAQEGELTQKDTINKETAGHEADEHAQLNRRLMNV